MTLKVQILQTLRRFFIILVGLTMTWFIEKNAYFQYMQTWFDAQLDQKIFVGIYFRGRYQSYHWFVLGLQTTTRAVNYPWSMSASIACLFDGITENCSEHIKDISKILGISLSVCKKFSNSAIGLWNVEKAIWGELCFQVIYHISTNSFLPWIVSTLE